MDEIRDFFQQLIDEIRNFFRQPIDEIRDHSWQRPIIEILDFFFCVQFTKFAIFSLLRDNEDRDIFQQTTEKISDFSTWSIEEFPHFFNGR